MLLMLLLIPGKIPRGFQRILGRSGGAEADDPQISILWVSRWLENFTTHENRRNKNASFVLFIVSSTVSMGSL